MRREDFERAPCKCPECQQAGVTDLEQRRDPQTGGWLHGYALRRWYDAVDKCFSLLVRDAAYKQGSES